MHCIHGATILFQDCHFIENHANDYGGAICFQNSSHLIVSEPVVIRCLFDGNTCGAPEAHSIRGGAVAVEGIYCNLSVSRCTFINSATVINGASGGAISVLAGCHATIDHCTLVQNYTYSAGAAVFVGLPATAEISASIIAFNDGGGAIQCYEGSVSLSCSDFYGNFGGDYIQCISGLNGIDGNISANPLFCGIENEDLPYSLDDDSPCLPNGDCGIMGA